MIILTKIAITSLIILLTSAAGVGLTSDDKRLYSWTYGFAVGFLISLLGLILCLIAYVWMR